MKVVKDYQRFVAGVTEDWIGVNLGPGLGRRVLSTLWYENRYRETTSIVSFLIVVLWLSLAVVFAAIPVLFLSGWKESLLVLMAGLSVALLARNIGVGLIYRKALADPQFFDFAIHHGLFSYHASDYHSAFRNSLLWFAFSVPLIIALLIAIMVGMILLLTSLIPPWLDPGLVVVLIFMAVALMGSSSRAKNYRITKK